MTAGSYDLDQVVVYDYFHDKAAWMTPAEAQRYIDSREGLAEVVDESDPAWKVFALMAGPKPKRTITPEERREE